jgi:hypothetical protein
MQQFCTYGSVRGAVSNGRPYRDKTPFSVFWRTWNQCVNSSFFTGNGLFQHPDREKPIRFALVETTPTCETQRPGQPQLELVLSGGERLHIPADAATLQLVLSALRQK